MGAGNAAPRRSVLPAADSLGEAARLTRVTFGVKERPPPQRPFESAGCGFLWNKRLRSQSRPTGCAAKFFRVAIYVRQTIALSH